ncbi:hypothetical protein HPB51_013538 [Rhipicephalus microplus]|uniref:Uncharacterized protein n=1 Tax=Rhipicephalus microplus TaxID=6941 RepID=A0A9J6EA52_RHIMP|nr:hypothetical protein HPB51_013538 [Rhipicephalus microplus]
MPQQIAMEGDDVTPEELQGNGWFSVLKRRQESRAKSHAARQSGTQRGATATPNATLRRVAAASRLPVMPRSHNRVIVRPGGGLNVQACSPDRISCRTNHGSSASAVAYWERIASRTLKLILIFNGLKVPNHVYCGQVIYRCTLYKRQIDTCRTCGQVGHREDVVPTPSTNVCDHCGHLPTHNPHVCNQPVCALCGEAHRTGNRECRHRYQLPYLVRRRRQRRRRRKQAQQQTPTAATSPVPAKTTKPKGPPLGPRNPTPTDQPTWADKVACKGEAHAAQRQEHSPQQRQPEIAQFKRMYAEQAKEIQSLKEELAKQQAPESREGSIISGPVSIRGAKKRAGPTLQAEEQSECDQFTANIYAILEQYRAETTAVYSAFNTKLESMQKQLMELAAWPAQMNARTKVLEEDLARSVSEALLQFLYKRFRSGDRILVVAVPQKGSVALDLCTQNGDIIREELLAIALPVLRSRFHQLLRVKRMQSILEIMMDEGVTPEEVDEAWSDINGRREESARSELCEREEAERQELREEAEGWERREKA